MMRIHSSTFPHRGPCQRFKARRLLIVFCTCFASFSSFLLYEHFFNEDQQNQYNEKPDIQQYAAEDLLERSRHEQYVYDAAVLQHHQHRHLLQSVVEASNVSTTTMSTAARKLSAGEYPPDVFTEAQLRNGAIALYVLGVMYMFVALAIVCDEFFVPSLEVITEKLKISEDVAGATFMAAGGSAPELFTSLIGTFIARSEVGIGTIIGSAVFNILFVIGMCGIFSKGVMQLTWWPLFRDMSFYSISLICLIIFFYDKQIKWWEALILLSCYAAYVIFMKFNGTIERFVKSKLQRNRVTSVESSTNSIGTAAQNCGETDQEVWKVTSKFRQGVLQLMLHTIDPLGEAKIHEKASKLHAIASLNGILGPDNNNSNGTAGTTTVEPIQVTVQPAQENGGGGGGGVGGSVAAISNGHHTGRGGSASHGRNISQQTNITMVTMGSGDSGTSSPHALLPMAQEPPPRSADSLSEDDDVEAEPEPLDLSWPDTWRKRITYVFVAPLMFPLWLTLPDVRRPNRRKFFPWTFLGSILWIGGFSYLMNWLAAVIGIIAGISDSVMGLTFLAAGTSIPDLITSVIVAKKGYGDMAVSSSVGSNIFDVTVGLPLPWLLYGLIYKQPYSVDSRGLFCSIVLLFAMLMLIIIIIAAFRWQMTKRMGGMMLGLYVVFLILALLLEIEIIPCVLSV